MPSSSVSTQESPKTGFPTKYTYADINYIADLNTKTDIQRETGHWLSWGGLNSNTEEAAGEISRDKRGGVAEGVLSCLSYYRGAGGDRFCTLFYPQSSLQNVNYPFLKWSPPSSKKCKSWIFF